MSFDRNVASEKLKNQQEAAFRFLDFNLSANETAGLLVSQALAQLDLFYLQEVVIALIKEVAVNAVKANLKRAFFADNKVDINDPMKYQHLMSRFRDEVIDEKEKFIPRLKKHALYSRLSFIIKDETLIVTVFNNCSMNENELKKVNDRLELAKTVKTLPEIFDKVSDSSEGEGLGLLINLMLLRNSGIGQENFSIGSDDTGTTVTVNIPKKVQRPAYVLEIEEKILNTVYALPTFPETNRRIIQLCNDPESHVADVAKEIEKDPALSSNLLKVANSSGYLGSQKASSIHTAATVVGLKVIRQLTIAISARHTLDENHISFLGFWEHSNKCAFYAKALAEKKGLRKQADTIYVGGLLHDIGKIILNSIDPRIIEQINGLVIDVNRRKTSLLEEITLGVSHARIGGLIAEKWNFSDELTDIIRCHHSPFIALEENQKMASVIHIADALIKCEESRGRYVYIELTARQLLQIKSEEELVTLHDEIKADFKKTG